MLKKYDKKIYDTFLIILFLILTVESVYSFDNNKDIFSSIMILMFLISNKLLDTKNDNLNKFESIFYFVASIILILYTFTNIINEITVSMIIAFTIVYILIIFLKIKERIKEKNKRKE